VKEEYFTYAEIDELVIPMIKELLSKIPVKAKEIYYKELSHPNNPRIIEIIYINPKTGAVCVDCDDEIPYGTELSELQLNRYDLLNIVRRLRR
jgi:hypothetical protein